MFACKPSSTPTSTKMKLNGSSDNPYHDPTEYCSLPDALQYLTLIRPNIFTSFDQCAYLCVIQKYNICRH